MSIAPNFGVVVEGQLYRSGQPASGALASIMNLYKIATIINLRGEDEDNDEWQEAARLGYHIENTPDTIAVSRQVGMHYMHIPLPGFHNASVADIRRIMGIVLDKFYWPVLVHCRRGADRTGTVVACYRLLNGWEIAAVFREAHHYGMSDLEIMMQSFITGFAAGHTLGA